MKKFKLIAVLLLINLCCGCTVNYNIIMKEDHTIDENVVFTQDNSELEGTEYTIEESINSKIESYQDDLKKANFKVSTDFNSDKAVVSLDRKNSLISSFTKLSYFQKMFNLAEIEEKDGKYSFKTTGVYNQAGLFYDLSGITDDGYIDDLNINIQFYNKVISCNGDSFNEYTNTCTWNINKDTTEKSIEFVLSDEVVEGIIPKEKFKFSDNQLIIILIIIIGFAVIITVVILNKKRNNI